MIELFSNILVGTEIAGALPWSLEAADLFGVEADTLLVIRTNFPLARTFGNVCGIPSDAGYVIADKNLRALLARQPSDRGAWTRVRTACPLRAVSQARRPTAASICQTTPLAPSNAAHCGACTCCTCLSWKTSHTSARWQQRT